MSQSSRGDIPISDLELFRELFSQVPERKIVFTAEEPFTFVAVTDGHLELTGKKREEIIGANFFELFPDMSEEKKRTGVSPLARTFKNIVTHKKKVTEVMRYDIRDADGGFVEKHWRVTHYPIADSNGHVRYILQTSTDITAEVIAERDYKEMRDQLEDALTIGKVGSWVWDVKNDVVVADANLAKMFGINSRQAKSGIPIDAFIETIHAEDRERVKKAIDIAVKEGTVFEQEYRTLATNGRVHWVLARGRVEKTANRITFPGVIVDITERRNLQAEIALARQQDQLNRKAAKILQERNDELEAISRTKDEFVALASHQLRTPATAVKQYIGMVLQGYAGDISELQNEMLEKAFESNERQIQIINQILNAARVDTGRLVMAPAPIDLCTLVRGVVTDMRSQFMQREHELIVAIPKNPITVLADLGYVRMVVENILSNACVYTPNGGKITVLVSKSAKKCEVRITDNGVGIRKADLSKLFSKFSRIHNPLSVQAGGSGIGLYLAAEIVRLHKGKITVESKIHKGTTFAISLPLAQNKP